MDTLERRIMHWAASRAEIRLVLMLTSRTHPAPLIGESADLDLHLFCTDHDPLLADPGWLESIGEVWSWLSERIADQIPQLRVLFDGGIRVNFALLPLLVVEGFTASGQLDEIYDGGFTVLLDKDDWISRIPLPQGQPAQHDVPTEGAFRRLVTDFLYGAVHVAKEFRRRDPRAIHALDCAMRELLLEMIEWHARALHRAEYDAFSDAQSWEELQHTLGGLGVSKSWHALFDAMKVFRRLATQTALYLQYEYPAALDRRITTFAEGLYKESIPSSTNQAIEAQKAAGLRHEP